jgi:hypothetical protein
MLDKNVLDHKFGCAEQLEALLAAVLVGLLLLDARRCEPLGLVFNIATTVVNHIDILDQSANLEVKLLNPNLVVALRGEGVLFAGRLRYVGGIAALAVLRLTCLSVFFCRFRFCSFLISTVVFRLGDSDFGCYNRLGLGTLVTNTLALELLGECGGYDTVVARIQAVPQVGKVLIQRHLGLRC